jgi:elongation factor Ts
MNKYFAELTLLKQTFWKDDSITIEDLIKNHIAKLGENIIVRQMSRIELGVSE